MRRHRAGEKEEGAQQHNDVNNLHEPRQRLQHARKIHGIPPFITAPEWRSGSTPDRIAPLREEHKVSRYRWAAQVFVWIGRAPGLLGQRQLLHRPIGYAHTRAKSAMRGGKIVWRAVLAGEEQFFVTGCGKCRARALRPPRAV